MRKPRHTVLFRPFTIHAHIKFWGIKINISKCSQKYAGLFCKKTIWTAVWSRFHSFHFSGKLPAAGGKIQEPQINRSVSVLRERTYFSSFYAKFCPFFNGIIGFVLDVGWQDRSIAGSLPAQDDTALTDVLRGTVFESMISALKGVWASNWHV
jgi:hypothetical protein